MTHPTKILVVDNYDSFTYNLVQLLGELGADLTVWRNRVGLMGSFSTGFTNYQPATTSVASPDASVRLLRVGLAYRLK